MVSQLLHHKADPFYVVKDGKLAGNSAMDLMDKECRLPQLDENAPKQMRAMLQLAMDGKPEGQEVIDKMWASFKSQNKKLYQSFFQERQLRLCDEEHQLGNSRQCQKYTAC